jgi:hypothetical protein
MTMRGLGSGCLALAAVLWLAAGCATSQEWTTWREHPTHFASGDHLSFSIKNTEGAPSVTRTDVARAREEAWWGKPVTVNQEQILER